MNELLIHRQRECFEKRTHEGLQENEMLSYPQTTSSAFYKTDRVHVNNLAAPDNFEDFKTELYITDLESGCLVRFDYPMQCRHAMYCTKISPLNGVIPTNFVDGLQSLCFLAQPYQEHKAKESQAKLAPWQP